MAVRRPQAFLLVDETYRHAVYGDKKPAPSTALLGERMIVTGSLSKCRRAPGRAPAGATNRNRTPSAVHNPLRYRRDPHSQ
jgi:hypothetical protein